MDSGGEGLIILVANAKITTGLIQTSRNIFPLIQQTGLQSPSGSAASGPPWWEKFLFSNNPTEFGFPEVLVSLNLHIFNFFKRRN